MKNKPFPSNMEFWFRETALTKKSKDWGNRCASSFITDIFVGFAEEPGKSN